MVRDGKYVIRWYLFGVQECGIGDHEGVGEGFQGASNALYLSLSYMGVFTLTFKPYHHLCAFSVCHILYYNNSFLNLNGTLLKVSKQWENKI